MSDAISPLLSALDDSDEKTRANAAGALGNLVRNGSDLAGDLCAYTAVDRLLVMCLREKQIFPQVIQDDMACATKGSLINFYLYF